MDGLLVDSEPCWHQARVRLAQEAGKSWTESDHQVVMGVSTPEWASYMLKRLELDMTAAELVERIVANMQEIYRQRIPFLPGAIQAVHLVSSRYLTGLASGSHRSLIETVLNDPYMQGRFRVVVSSDALPHGKPAPDIYLEAARLLGISPENCLCLEDSKNGILAGVAAGMKVIAVPDPRYKPPDEILHQADIVLSSLEHFSLELVGQLR